MRRGVVDHTSVTCLYGTVRVPCHDDESMQPCMQPHTFERRPHGMHACCVARVLCAWFLPQGRLGAVVAILFLFSLTVQMSEGLTYGVVPYVSRPALGVVSGMVGAGGNAGALITNALFFTANIRSDLGFVYLSLIHI